MARRRQDETTTETTPGRLLSRPQLIVIAKRQAGLRTRGAAVSSFSGMNIAPLADLLQTVGVPLRLLFGADEEIIQREQQLTLARSPFAPHIEVPDLSLFYDVPYPAGQDPHQLAARLIEHDAIETAYVKPPPSPAVLWQTPGPPSASLPPVNSPDYTSRQGYLDAAPGGVDARYAWTFPGGGGQGVHIIDVEGEWRFTHEDLRQNKGGVVGGAPPNDQGWRNHGTAVLGVFSGDRNNIGVTGICPEANVRAFSIFTGRIDQQGRPEASPPTAIQQAARMLQPGDILLIELHYPGPRYSFSERQDQLGYIAVEWFADEIAAIQYAVRRGVIVVEAAGNGSEDLDDNLYDTNPTDPQTGQPMFPSTWRNPFRRNPVDSGAILVGAGAPPPGTHGQDHGPDRSRLPFSNYGSAIDVQGWGLEVTSTGGKYNGEGDLQGGPDEDKWYTDVFGGTSGASPVIVGSLGCVQGALRAAGQQPLDPARARNILRETGSPQPTPTSQRIGNRPDLRAIFGQIGLSGGEWHVQFTETVEGGSTGLYKTAGWPKDRPARWRIVPKGQDKPDPHLTWAVDADAANGSITYVLSVTNSSSTAIAFDAQFQI